jgi:hypothetical protein
MYMIEKDKKKIKRILECDFSSIGIKERQEIEEWVEKNPEILNEELLIIQKEFDGFDETSERLDLLALDAEGNLVVIELKRDDSGTEVNWQAIKYAAYCSSLTIENIFEIYSHYLVKIGAVPEPIKTEASARIAEFLDTKEENLILNTKQRIILVSKQYRKEVLATVMWLLDNNIDIKCVRIQPYKDVDTGSLFIVPTVILPPPNTEDYRIKTTAVRKEQENKIKSKGNHYDFFTKLKVSLNNLMNTQMPFSSKIGVQYYKIKTIFPLNIAHFEFNYLPDSSYFAVGLHFESSKEENMRIIEALIKKVPDWESIQGIVYEPDWRWGINFHIDCDVNLGEEKLFEIAVENMKKLYYFFNPALEAVYNEMHQK